MSGASLGSSFEVVDAEDGRRIDADLRGVAGEYFPALRIPLVAGRWFTDADAAAGPPVGIVDRAFARRLRADGNVLGMRIRWIRRPDDPIRIVGIVGDVRHRGPEEAPRETVYRPAAQYARGAMTMVLRGRNAAALTTAAAAAIQAIDPAQPIADVAPMIRVAERAIARPRLAAVLASALGIIALAVAVVGVYGVLSYGVSQRVREFALRLAIGATPLRIVALVFKEGALVTVTGIAIGCAVAPSAAKLLASALFGVGPTDLPAYAAAALALGAAAAVACYIPARRASRSDPMSVLRSE
jgi:putative ABC transport system permease protein